MPGKAWKQKPPPPAGFARSLGLPPFHAHLLYNRGIREPDLVERHLSADSRLSNDPMLLPDMDGAVSRIRKAIPDRELIGVFGDFDTDGIAGTALLVRALRGLDARTVSYLPDRVDEGHGLSAEAIKTLHSKGVSLLVTVDCGVGSVEEVGLAASLGIDTIITDHHSLPEVAPKAIAVVNPKRADSAYPFPELTGAGLSFKLVEAIYAAAGRSAPSDLLEIAALGTVADVAPLIGENRYIVKEGLKRLNRTQNPGLIALIASSGQRRGFLDTESMSYGLIPRLNAAGRLGDATISLELLIALSAEKAGPIAEKLEQSNIQRRALTEEGMAQAGSQLQNGAGEAPPVIIVEHEDWLPGILGLIAGRLAEQYYRPAVAVTVGPHVSRASARSIPEFNIVEALQSCRDLFDRYGGHPRAAGFTIPTENLPRLKNELMGLADKRLRGLDLVPTIEIDCEISPSLLDDKNYEFVLSLSPFGEGNPAPVYLTRNVVVVEARQVGARGAHLKMRIAHEGRSWDAIAFRQGDRPVSVGDRLELVYTADMDDWGGRRRLQLKVLDFRPTG